MALETPPRRALGDIAVPVAFALARRLRKAPRAIAQELAGALGPIDGVARVEAAPERLPQLLPRPRLLGPAAGWRSTRLRPRPPVPERPSSSTRRSTRTRRRTSATCATPRSATPSDGCSASRAARSRSRTTSTTPASRSPTSSSASASSNGRRSPTSAPSPNRPASTTTAGTSTRRSPSGTQRRRQGAAQDPHRGAPRHRARRQRDRRHRRLHRRTHRPRAT